MLLGILFTLAQVVVILLVVGFIGVISPRVAAVSACCSFSLLALRLRLRR